MERKIGEIFEYNGEWYQCIVGNGCENCAFYGRKCYTFTDNNDPIADCCADRRKDNKDVIFKKLEKVGGTYAHNSVIVQKYRIRTTPVIMPNEPYMYFNAINNTIEIEIKQTKENMKENEENKYDRKMDKECIPLCDALNSLPDVETTESCCGHCKDRFRIFFKCKNPYSLSVIARVFNRRYSGTKLQWIIEVETHDNGGYDYFVHSVEAYENNTMMEKDISQLVENIKYWSSEKYKEYFINGVTSEEKKKLNLKPFNLEEAKAGKPVCTRDGRKARIICFDYKGDGNAYPILALISTSNLSGTPSEIIAKYTEDGRYTKYNSVENGEDLMMLSEKKEGWVNVYKERIYSTKEEAIEATYDGVTYVDTVKISWEE